MIYDKTTRLVRMILHICMSIPALVMELYESQSPTRYTYACGNLAGLRVSFNTQLAMNLNCVTFVTLFYT